jgi:serine/threonine protein phosphatase PrpC
MDGPAPAAASQPPTRIEDAAAKDKDVILAKEACLETLERVQMDQIDSGPVDYVVKCTEGLFSGRFIYVNRTPQGELFGSDKTSKDITMYIENANLSPKHTEIKFNDQTYQYFLRDLASTDGTWVRIRWNRSIEIAPGQELKIGNSVVSVGEGRSIPSMGEAKQWLAAYQLQHLAPQLQTLGLETLQDIRKSMGTLVSSLAGHIKQTETVILGSALAELDKMWPATGYPNHALEFTLRTARDPQPICTIGWEGGTIALAPNGVVEEVEDDELDMSREDGSPKDVTVGVVPIEGWEKCEWLRVGYSFGRYYVHLSERSSESVQKGWVRLRQDQRHWLQPHDLFRIGSLEFQVLRFNAAVYSEQGFRATMEDEEILLQDLATSNWRHCSFFGIYDGHGGRECVSFVRQRLHMNFVAALHGKGGLDKSCQVHHDIHDSLTHGFLETDRQFLSMASTQPEFNGGSGCAAVVACIIGGWIWCANVGDSRALLCRDGKAVQLSLDHKPDREDEAQRIESAGGFVSFRRVLGRLAVSRAFGDEEYKQSADTADPNSSGKSLVIADPEIRVEQLTPQDEFLFMACDGLFDVFSSQEAVEFMHSRLASMPSNEQDPQRAVQDIVHEAIHERRSRDNVTALLVTFKRAVLTPGRRGTNSET